MQPSGLLLWLVTVRIVLASALLSCCGPQPAHVTPNSDHTKKQDSNSLNGATRSDDSYFGRILRPEDDEKSEARSDESYFGYLRCPEGTEVRLTKGASATLAWTAQVACHLSDGQLHGPFQRLYQNRMVVGAYNYGKMTESRMIRFTDKIHVPL